MSGSKISYIILLSFMALYAALAQGAEAQIAAKEHAAVMRAVLQTNTPAGQLRYAKALEAYDRAYTAAITPRPKAQPKAQAPKTQPKAIALKPKAMPVKAQPVKTITAVTQTAAVAPATAVHPADNTPGESLEDKTAEFHACMQTKTVACCSGLAAMKSDPKAPYPSEACSESSVATAAPSPPNKAEPKADVEPARGKPIQASTSAM